MSKIIPPEIINVYRSFNDLGLNLYGISCSLFIPRNLTALEPNDLYTRISDIQYTRYDNIPVWIEWFVKDLHRLRKLGVFAENETPILARFKLDPNVTIQSYIKLESSYIPDNFDTDEFEVVDVLMSNMYDSEIYRHYKLAPRRKKT